jgi:hypothetical protein
MASNMSWQSIVRCIPVRPSAVVFAAVLIATLAGFVGPAFADTVICDGELSPTPAPRIAGEPQVSQQPDLLVRSTCLVKGSPHFYNTVNIVKGGKLIFVERDPHRESGRDAGGRFVQRNGSGLAIDEVRQGRQVRP